MLTDGNDEIMLTTHRGMSIRFEESQLRDQGRATRGVRGIRLAKSDSVISMSILRHMDVTVEERDSYLRYAGGRRRAEGTEVGEDEAVPPEAVVELDPARLAELEANEQFILSIADDGLGKRTSAYEYRVSGRGGQGVTSMDLSRRAGRAKPKVVAAFPIDENDELVLVTDGGQLIRSPVHDIRVAGRATRGVTLFRVGEDERVVSVARLEEDDEPEQTEGAEADAEAEAEAIDGADDNGADDNGADDNGAEGDET